MSCIKAKGYNGGLLVEITDTAISFDKVMDEFKEFLNGNKNFILGMSKFVSFNDKNINTEQKNKLTICFNNFISEYGKQIDIAFKPEEEIKHETETVFHYGDLRSGQILENYSGDIFMIGDAKPGCEIIASGNIIVIGVITKSKVHAGCMGRLSAYIFSLGCYPNVLKIANKLAKPPDTMSDNIEANLIPQMALIKNGVIYVENHNLKHFKF